MMPAPGRPSAYSEPIGETIASRMMEGESLRSICRDEEMPHVSTVCRWLAKEGHPFREQYAHARDVQAEIYADEIVEIADDGRNDFMERETGDGDAHEVVNQENIQRSRLRVDARKWVVSKLLPKKYGDRMTHANDPDNPIVPVLNVNLGGQE